MLLDSLFVLCVAVAYSEPVLTRILGETIANALVLLCTCGLCSLMAVSFMKAL